MAATAPDHAAQILAIGSATGLAAALMVARLGFGRHRPDTTDEGGQDGTAWRLLAAERFIDGYALWDCQDRLIDHAGFLARYLPDLDGYPPATEVVRRLVEGGHVVIPDGMTRTEMIDTMCLMRRAIPGLREMRMADDQVFQARTVDLDDGNHVCVFTNVTQLRRHETNLRAAEALFRTAFESGPSMMILVDGDERPIAVNRAFTARLGYSLEQLAELGLKGILHPDDDGRPAADAPWVPVIKRILAADGSVLRGQIRYSPVRAADGTREGRLLVTIEDLTSRWEAEEQVRYQASLLDQVTNAVLSVDNRGRVVYANRAAQTLFQWADNALRGTPVERLLGADVARLMGGDATVLETTGATWTGATFPASVAMSRLTDDSGHKVVGTVLAVTDLTQRRAMDMQMVHSARLATLGEMSASIAHEFNQCLHIIRLSSEALTLGLDDGGPDSGLVARRAENILSQVDRLTDMVMQMRTISRREDGGKQPFSAQAALDGAIAMAEPLMRADGIGFNLIGSLAGLTVLGHQVRLEQVLLNLLNNARDAIHDRMRQGGGRGGMVTVLCDSDPVRRRLTIRVQDDGCGIPAPLIDTLFDPFVTTKDETRGCGLGLSISRGIVTQMDGSLGVANLDRGGAEFTIELPLAPHSDTRAPRPAAASALAPTPDAEDHEDPAIDGRRLLLVDDEALSVMMLAEFLEHQGYRVDTAYDGVEALEKIRADVYDVVITDIRMPRMDGRELIRHLAELQPGTPVIVVTGHLKEGSQADLGDNVIAVLSKPFQLIEMRRLLAGLEAEAAMAAD